MTHPVVKGYAAIEQPNWAAREMARVNLGDQRLNRRAARLASNARGEADGE